MRPDMYKPGVYRGYTYFKTDLRKGVKWDCPRCGEYYRQIRIYVVNDETGKRVAGPHMKIEPTSIREVKELINILTNNCKDKLSATVAERLSMKGWL